MCQIEKNLCRYQEEMGWQYGTYSEGKLDLFMVVARGVLKSLLHKSQYAFQILVISSIHVL